MANINKIINKMMRRSCLGIVVLVLVLIGGTGNSSAWEIKFTDTFDDGAAPLLKDIYIIGNGGADGYVLGEDLFQVSTPPYNPSTGNPQSGVYEQPYFQMVSTVEGYLLLRDIRDGTDDSWTVDKWRYVPGGMGTLTGAETISWAVTGTPPSGLQLSYSGSGTGSGDTDLTTLGTYTISNLSLSGEGSYGTITIEVPPSTGSISGIVQLNGALRSATVDFELKISGVVQDSATIVINADGTYGWTGIAPNTYDVFAKKANTLKKKVASVVVSAGLDTPNVNFTLPGGDANDDNFVGGTDLSLLSGSYNTSVSPDTGADFNGDGFVGGTDLSILSGNYNQSGDD